MPVEAMAAATADIAVGTLDMDMLLEDMPQLAILRVDTLTNLRMPGKATGALQVAHVIGMAAAIGEAVTGIRTMDIPASAIMAGGTAFPPYASAIMAGATAIHTTALAITVTPVGTMVRTTGTTLTATVTGQA